MSNRPFLFICLLIFTAILLGCALTANEDPLPTRVPTAESLLSQGNLGRQNTAVPATNTAPPPTQSIPTASPTSSPAPTETAAALAEAFTTVAADQDSVRDFTTAAAQQPTQPAPIEQNSPTPTPSPSPAPTSTPTNVPIPTNTPTPVPLPHPPDVIWPSPEPYLPIAATHRHGVAAALGGGAEGVYGAGQYTWTFSWTPYVPPVEKSSQHIPMIASSPRSQLPPLNLIKQYDSYNSHNYWLVFNECEHQGQCNTSPAEAAQFFHDQVLDLLYTQGGDPDADFIIGGGNAHPCGIQWLKNFIDYYRANYGEVPRAGWHFHLYPEMIPGGWPNNCNGDWGFLDENFQNPEMAFNLWREHANNVLAFVQEYGRPDDEIWFTEMGCLNYGYHQLQILACQSTDFVRDYAARIVNWLNTDGRWVTRYAWYTNWDTNYWKKTHLIAEAPAGQQWTYSSLGYWYANVVPSAAVPLPWP